MAERSGGRPENTIYCPYSDTDVARDDANDEHIIPLALGGSNALTVPVSRGTNSKLGSEVDGALCKEFIVHSARAQHDSRGHSGRAPVLHMKNAREMETGRPLSLAWSRRLEVFDPIERRRRTKPVRFEMKFTVDIDIRLRFLAKCFLSAGYLVYGEFFRRAVRHGDARLIMRPRQELTADENASIRTRYYAWLDRDRFTGRESAEFERQMRICSLIDGSLLLFMRGRANLGIFGSVLGVYLGMLNVPADMTEFPITEEHDLGHAIVVEDGELIRCSHRTLWNEAAKYDADAGPPPATAPG
jgi:hypothetical protein